MAAFVVILPSVSPTQAEQRHAASKEDLHGAETRLNQAISALEVRLVALSERTDAIKEHYATKWFILTSMIAMGSLIVAAMKLL